jgi:FkbM family methyltransferase
MPIASLEEYERIDPRCTIEVFGRKLVFSTPNQMTKWRVDSLIYKEPATIAWLGEFRSSDVFVDVGANVGMYTILAAAAQGCRVVAFEPESQNFALLSKNIFSNGLADRVTAYPLGLSDSSGLSVLHLANFSWGSSCHSLGASVDHTLAARQSALAQGSIAARLDDLVGEGAVPQPTRLKIDVDGFEHKVIAGAVGVLRDTRLQSVLIEINRNIPEHRHLIDQMGEWGFGFDPEQVRHVERQEGTFIGCAEYIFRRSA